MRGEGMAWAFVRYSSDHVGQETRAKAERLRAGVGVAGAAKEVNAPALCQRGPVAHRTYGGAAF